MGAGSSSTGAASFGVCGVAVPPCPAAPLGGGCVDAGCAPAGGCCAGDYSKYPKGNLDVTGRYFIWTTNLSGNRLDAFVVKVPSQLLVADEVPPAAPTGLSVN